MLDVPADAHRNDEAAVCRATRSAALVPLFRGRFCNTLLPNRAVRVFEEDEVLYEMAARERTFFFVLTGIVKIGTITESGREIIYDLRKARDVVGELCALEALRRDRAVAVERAETIPVPFEDVMASLAEHPALLHDFVGMFCSALADAREQVSAALNTLRRRGIAQYSRRGRLILDMRALHNYAACAS
jgi:CRP-like cAMP-binding protein